MSDWRVVQVGELYGEIVLVGVCPVCAALVDTDGDDWNSHERWHHEGNASEAPVICNESEGTAIPEVNGDTSDGHHTFNELYRYRMLYNALLFNEWAELDVADVHKSWNHHDGKPCFGGGWFVVVAETVAGQITNHYPEKDWDRFCVPERETAAEWDGHDAAEAARRMEHLLDIAAGKVNR